MDKAELRIVLSAAIALVIAIIALMAGIGSIEDGSSKHGPGYCFPVVTLPVPPDNGRVCAH